MKRTIKLVFEDDEVTCQPDEEETVYLDPQLAPAIRAAVRVWRDDGLAWYPGTVGEGHAPQN